MIKLFDLSAMGYIETLFGHQDCIHGVDALRKETAVSVGGRDRTIRYWKVIDETQLVFRGGGKSALREVLEGGLEGLEEDEGKGAGIMKTTKVTVTEESESSSHKDSQGSYKEDQQWMTNGLEKGATRV